MSLGQSVAPHLPYLRRYGRSISGSQHNGDALVARLLETLVAAPGAIDTGADLRIQLYRLVHDNFGLMTQQAAANDAGALTDIAIADARLHRIHSLSRPALLHTAVQGFRAEDPGRIAGRVDEAGGRVLGEGPAR